MGTIGAGTEVPSIAENSQGEEDVGDEIELIDGEIPENKGEDQESEDDDGSEVEAPQDDELSQEQEEDSHQQDESLQSND